VTNPLHRLREVGQSVWYDNVRRVLIDSGQLAAYLDEYAVSGITSNPTIFEHAISGSDDYDGALRRSVEAGVEDPEALLWELAIRDIRDAADLLRPTYDASGGADGFVSLELHPRVSRDAAGSIEFGEQLFARLDRPNTMIKVPGTEQGVPAIEELIARGVNVNVTLLFSRQLRAGASGSAEKARTRPRRPGSRVVAGAGFEPATSGL
jgi:transaldolase